MKKIMLISPNSTTPFNGIRRLTTPLGLLYIGAVLKQNGFDVNVLDSTCEGYNNVVNDQEGYVTYGLSNNEIEKRVLDFKPDIVGVSSPFSARHKKALEICEIIKSNSNIPIVIGGLHPTQFPYETLNSGLVDYLVLGEGDFKMKNLIELLNSNKKPDLEGIAYICDGNIKISKSKSVIPNLDIIPFPARELVDMEQYFKVSMPFAPYSKKGRVEQVSTSRGCTGNCNFCSTIDFWGRRFRARSSENVLSEIEELVTKYGVEEIQFADDNLILNKERALNIFKGVKNFNISMCTPQGLLMRALDEELLKSMGEAGVYQITVNPESGSQRVLKEIIHKSVPPKERVKQLTDVAHDYGIQIHGVFVVGFPGEKKGEIFETLNYPSEVGFDSVAFFPATPVPGSRLYKECVEKGYISKFGEEEWMMDFGKAVIRIPKNSPDYYGMEPEELDNLIEQRTRGYNESYKERDINSWKEKFEPFLERHPEEKEKLMNRMS